MRLMSQLNDETGPSYTLVTYGIRIGLASIILLEVYSSLMSTLMSYCINRILHIYTDNFIF